MLPLPEAVQVPLPEVQVQVHAVSVAGNVSATVEPGASFGPALDAAIVYTTGVPGTAVVAPSVIVMPRFAGTVAAGSVSVSVVLLLAGVGSVMPPAAMTIAVLLSEPVAAADTLQFAV
jgi:hypothetical protein